MFQILSDVFRNSWVDIRFWHQSINWIYFAFTGYGIEDEQVVQRIERESRDIASIKFASSANVAFLNKNKFEVGLGNVYYNRHTFTEKLQTNSSISLLTQMDIM